MRALVWGIGWGAIPVGVALPLAIQYRFAVLDPVPVPFVPGDWAAALHAALPFTAVSAVSAWVLARREALGIARVLALVTVLVSVIVGTAGMSWSIWTGVHGATLASWHLGATMLGPIAGFGAVPLTFAVASRVARRFYPPGVGATADRSRAGTIAMLLVVCITGALQAIGIVPTLFVEPGLLRIREAELLLQRPHVYRPVAERLALYCQSEPGLVPESMGAAYLPAPLRSRPHAAVYSSKEGASVELGGGFHHFGYDLEPVVQASTKDTRAWRLSFRSEGSPTLPLVTVRLPATAQASRDQISKWLGEAFPDQLAGAPASAAVHASRVQAHIRLGQVEAALRASDEWIAAAPEKVVPRFTRAHLLARLSQLASGAGEFARWVEAHASFEHRCYLFLFHMREGQAEQALAALRSALREPIELSATGPFNAAALGRDGAVFAFLQGDSRLSIELCQKLLDTNPEGFTRDLLILKAAAQARLGEWPAALETLERASATPAPSWREQGADDVILEAIRSRNLATIADYKRWRDPLADWCTPFDKDEAGARGGDPERFPNPYPRDWRRHAF